MFRNDDANAWKWIGINLLAAGLIVWRIGIRDPAYMILAFTGIVVALAYPVKILQLVVDPPQPWPYRAAPGNYTTLGLLETRRDFSPRGDVAERGAASEAGKVREEDKFGRSDGG